MSYFYIVLDFPSPPSLIETSPLLLSSGDPTTIGEEGLVLTFFGKSKKKLF